LTTLTKELTLKIAFVIIRRSQKQQFSQKQTQQPKTKLQKSSDSSVAIFISQGHSTTEFGAFF